MIMFSHPLAAHIKTAHDKIISILHNDFSARSASPRARSWLTRPGCHTPLLSDRDIFLPFSLAWAFDFRRPILPLMSVWLLGGRSLAHVRHQKYQCRITCLAPSPPLPIFAKRHRDNQLNDRAGQRSSDGLFAELAWAVRRITHRASLASLLVHLSFFSAPVFIWASLRPEYLLFFLKKNPSFFESHTFLRGLPYQSLAH